MEVFVIESSLCTSPSGSHLFSSITHPFAVWLERLWHFRWCPVSHPE